MKKLLFLSFAVSLSTIVHAQRKVEYIVIEWPAEYKWQIISQKDDSTGSATMIIPGNENTSNATLLGSIRSRKGVYFNSLNLLIDYYKRGMDTGTVFTLIDSSSTETYPWIIFKVETPITDKYPEPESDLYIAIQGEYAVYESYIAVKEPALSKEFVGKWSAIFKTARIKIQ